MPEPYSSAPVYSDFAARFLELVSPTPTSAQQTWIAGCLSREWDDLDSGYWGAKRGEASLLRAAHRWALIRQAGGLQAGTAGTGAMGIPVGALTSITVGQYSFGYTAPSNSRSSGDRQDWGRTGYGQEYLSLRDTRLGNLDRVSL